MARARPCAFKLMSRPAPAPAQQAARGADTSAAAGKQSAHLHAAAVALAAAAPSVSALMGARSRAVSAAGRCEPLAQARALRACGTRVRSAHAALPCSRGRATFAALCCCPATRVGTPRPAPPLAQWVKRLSPPRATAPQHQRAGVQGQTRRRRRRAEPRHDAVPALQPHGACYVAERAARARADAATSLPSQTTTTGTPRGHVRAKLAQLDAREQLAVAGGTSATPGTAGAARKARKRCVAALRALHLRDACLRNTADACAALSRRGGIGISPAHGSTPGSLGKTPRSVGGTAMGRPSPLAPTPPSSLAAFLADVS